MVTGNWHLRQEVIEGRDKVNEGNKEIVENIQQEVKGQQEMAEHQQDVGSTNRKRVGGCLTLQVWRL